jgi:ArsR family transcriptional regulator, arsenate/arsenite/antimonite-responsive transcriptional repressor
VDLTRQLQAVAEPTRRAILRILTEGEKSAGEVAAHFEISVPSVSHHLSILRAAGLVHAERRGQSVIYRREADAIRSMLDGLIGDIEPIAQP